MYYKNTTNIPDQLVGIIANFVMPEGIDITEIILRNKQAGSINGNWGMYYPLNRKITLTVPQEIKGFKDLRSHRREWVEIRNRTEFVVMVMAHEMRHAWQYQKSGWSHTFLNNKIPKEYDAETYEADMLDKWRLFINEQNKQLMAARNSTPNLEK